MLAVPGASQRSAVGLYPELILPSPAGVGFVRLRSRGPRRISGRRLAAHLLLVQLLA